MLDMHIIVSKNTRPDWVRQCLSSIRIAMVMASFPVALHTIDGCDGHIGKGRAQGYAQGTFPWVTCVDDDDMVLPEGLVHLSEGFSSGKSAISTLEIEMRNNAFRVGGRRHHLTAYRRERIIQHETWKCCGDVAQTNAIPSSEWFDGTLPGYLWRVYPGSKARDLRLSNPNELGIAHG